MPVDTDAARGKRGGLQYATQLVQLRQALRPKRGAREVEQDVEVDASVGAERLDDAPGIVQAGPETKIPPKRRVCQ